MNEYLARLMPALLLICSSMVLAEDGPHDKAIRARQSVMQLYGYHIGILSAMEKGKMHYNADLATEAANNLLAVNTQGQSTLWPQGSDDTNPENAASVQGEKAAKAVKMAKLVSTLEIALVKAFAQRKTSAHGERPGFPALRQLEYHLFRSVERAQVKALR